MNRRRLRLASTRRPLRKAEIHHEQEVARSCDLCCSAFGCGSYWALAGEVKGPPGDPNNPVLNTNTTQGPLACKVGLRVLRVERHGHLLWSDRPHHPDSEGRSVPRRCWLRLQPRRSAAVRGAKGSVGPGRPASRGGAHQPSPLSKSRPRSTPRSSKDVVIWVALILGALILVALAILTGLSQAKL